MLGNYKLIVDKWAEVWDLLEPYADHSFYRWPSHFDPGAIYIVGRVVLRENWQAIVDLASQYPGRIIFSNPAEGSETIKLQLKRLRITEQVKNGQIGLLCSGDVEPGFGNVSTDVYFSNIVTYLENIAARNQWQQVYESQHKPYTFLMLNGRLRPHRKWLIDALRQRQLLDRALWTNLNDHVAMPWSSKLTTEQHEPIRLLPACYEIDQANLSLDGCQDSFVKHDLFKGIAWGDAVINPRVYTDTYFSLVTETIFDYPYSFRTEKIYKPMIMCHPFVVAANAGYYRDLQRVGFQTFGHLIDESFDRIDNSTDRAKRIVDVVADICYNGLWEFLTACRSVCEHNYQQLLEHNQHERNRLPLTLQRYLDERFGIPTPGA